MKQADLDEKLAISLAKLLSVRIMKQAALDEKLAISLANVNDLIATEAKYHLKCLKALDRKIDRKRKPKINDDDTCLKLICTGLVHGLSVGNVYDMGNVWSTYRQLCEKMLSPQQSICQEEKHFMMMLKT